MMIRGGAFVLILVAFLLAATSAATSAAEPPSATEFYRQAVVTMNALKEPPFITYRLEAIGEGLRVDIDTEPCTFLHLRFGNNQFHWTVRNRTSDHLAEVIDAAGRRDVIDFDPSWAGTYRQLRSAPLGGPHDICRPQPLQAPEPIMADLKLDPAVKTIGAVLAIGPGIYRVEDRGSTSCPGGEPGHALHLSSRSGNPNQILSDVVVEPRSMRFCMVRFGARLGIGVAADTFWERHFAEVGDYWMETDGLVGSSTRIAGIASTKGVWRYQLRDIQFPTTVPLEAFAPTPNDPSVYTHAQRLVDIGGRKLNLYCTGTGLPTVILEAGGGESSLDWRFVQPLLTKKTRTCSYDRAGYGFSERGPLPRDAAATVSDLHALVIAAGIPKPFVLVGYSNGELYSRLYADRYLSDLAGLVLIEPAFEGDQEARVDAAAPVFAQNAVQQIAHAQACAAASESGPILPGTPSFASCATAPDPLLPQAINDMLRAQSVRAGWWTDNLSENVRTMPSTRDLVRVEQRSYGALPLAMVTAENIVPPGVFPSAEERSIREIMRAGRAPLMQLSSRGYQAQADGCSHGDILGDCADTVVTAIRAVVAVH